MTVYMDLENLLKEKNISKNKVCEACNLQRTQLNNYCKNKVTRIDFSILAKLCEYLDFRVKILPKLIFRYVVFVYYILKLLFFIKIIHVNSLISQFKLMIFYGIRT